MRRADKRPVFYFVNLLFIIFSVNFKISVI